MKKFDCDLCNDIVKKCKKKGKGKKCEKIIDDFYSDKISDKQFKNKLEKEMGKGFVKSL